jgi:hypothetical protein
MAPPRIFFTASPASGPGPTARGMHVQRQLGLGDQGRNVVLVVDYLPTGA